MLLKINDENLVEYFISLCYHRMFLCYFFQGETRSSGVGISEPVEEDPDGSERTRHHQRSCREIKRRSTEVARGGTAPYHIG